VSDYTPTTDEVKNAWAGLQVAVNGKPYEVADAEFYRWLADHDAEVAARAWEEGAKAEGRYLMRAEDADAAGQGVMVYREENPYRTEAQA